MTWQDHIRAGMEKLSQAGIENAAREARLLWEYASGRSYADWVLHPEETPKSIIVVYDQVLGRRVRREPFHYIVGSKEFMGLSLRVSAAVLIPRPETEILVETVLDHLPSKIDRVVDVGTGSGAIALALRDRIKNPETRIFGIDPSVKALRIAAENGKRLGLPVTWLQGSLLDSIENPLDVVVANLPYVSTKDRDQLAPELSFEPAMALYGGPIGTELIAALIDAAQRKLVRGGHIFLEVGQGQAPWTMSHLQGQGFQGCQTVQDYGGIERVIWAKRED